MKCLSGYPKCIRLEHFSMFALQFEYAEFQPQWHSVHLLRPLGQDGKECPRQLCMNMS